MEYNLYADFLAKFSYLTPWIQALITIMSGLILISPLYFIKQMVIETTKILSLNNFQHAIVKGNVKLPPENSISKNYAKNILKLNKDLQTFQLKK